MTNLCAEQCGCVVKLLAVSTTTLLRFLLPSGAFPEGFWGRVQEGLWLPLSAVHTQAVTKNREMWSQHPSQMGWRLPRMGAGRNPRAGAAGSTTGSPRRGTEGQTTSAQDSWDPGPAEQQAAGTAHVAHGTFSPDLPFGSAAAGWGHGGLLGCQSSLHVSIAGRGVLVPGL